MTGLLIDDINKMKKPIIKMGLLALTSAYLLTGCTQQVTDNMAFKNGQPNSERMFMDLSEDKELSASLSKNWNKVDYNKKGITTLKEENIVTGVKSSEFTANYLVNYEKSIYPKDYIAFAQKRGNTVKKYNSTINKKAMNRIDPSFSATHFYQDTQNNYHNVATAPFYIEYDKDGRVVSALGSYVYKSGKYDITADCYHTYFSGAKAKIIETIFTKKELEDNLAF
jgi:major membrane immunogen (membrane-anchored lipoprotein)